jgi:hypothetical protein
MKKSNGHLHPAWRRVQLTISLLAFCLLAGGYAELRAA